MAKSSHSWTLFEAAHLLNRAGFGGSPGEIKTLHERGRVGAVDWLLAAKESEKFPPPPWVAGLGEERRSYAAQLRGLAGLSAAEKEKARRDFQRERRMKQRSQDLTLLGWWVERMRRTDAPLQEKMTFFWHDHFATSTQKVRQPGLMYQQNELFRTESLGNFGRLTHAITRDPAMMIYLDSAQSNKTKPNENFARELMELFMLGEGAYSEEDIREAARAFTGYRLNRVTGEVTFSARQWDDGEKVLLGERGKFNAESVVDLLLRRPECGRYLAGKLWEYFAYEKPSSEVVEGLARTLVAGGYELKPLLREIFLHKEFYTERAMRSQIKSPVEYLVMLSRQLELGRMPSLVLLQTLQQLGQVPFLPPNVAGWDWGRAWVNTNTLLSRYHFAGIITGAGGDLKLTMGGEQGKKGKGGGRAFLNGAMQRSLPKPDLERIAPREQREDVRQLVDALGFRLFQAPLKEKDRAAFESYAKAKKGVVFTNTEVAELLHLMMSTPSYQLT